MIRISLALVIAIIFFNLTCCLHATPHNYCKKYIKQAARKTGVLPEILWAVAKAESNYGDGPWPWTINVHGKAHYFSSRLQASNFLKTLNKKGKFRIDVGCMQLNWGYHGSFFPNLTKMLKPELNIMYAAYFLKYLYNQTGHWSKALANYHSRKWERGGKYANHIAHLINDYDK